MQNAIRVAFRGPSEADHKRQYTNYHYSGEWKIEGVAIPSYETVNRITGYKIVVKSKHNQWDVYRRYSDFTDLNFHLNLIEKHINIAVTRMSISQPVNEAKEEEQQKAEKDKESCGLFEGMIAPLPKKTINRRDFHILPETSRLLEERRKGLEAWLSEVVTYASSETLDPVQRNQVHYELNWFLDAGAHLEMP
jgi:hypothetical protein